MTSKKPKVDQKLTRECYVNSKIMTEENAWRKIFRSQIFVDLINVKMENAEDEGHEVPAHTPKSMIKNVKSRLKEKGINNLNSDLTSNHTDGMGRINGIGVYLREDGLVEWEDRKIFGEPKVNQRLPREWYVKSKIMTQDDAFEELFKDEMFNDEVNDRIKEKGESSTIDLTPYTKADVVKEIQSEWKKRGINYYDWLYLRKDGLVEWQEI